MASFLSSAYSHEFMNIGFVVTCWNDWSNRVLIFNPLDMPRFVVITITPLAPCIPYKACVEASFNTDMDSISAAEIYSIVWLAL